jgi:hypothetical protein
MGRKATISWFGAMAATQDMVQITAGSQKVLKVAAIHVEQSNRAGDAQAQQVRLEFIRGTGGGGGTAITPRTHCPSDAALTSTAAGSQTGTLLTALTPTVILCEGGMNVQGGWHWTPPPGYEWEVGGTALVALKLLTAPTASTDFEITIECEECG